MPRQYLTSLIPRPKLRRLVAGVLVGRFASHSFQSDEGEPLRHLGGDVWLI